MQALTQSALLGLRDGILLPCESEFVESFRSEIEIPASIPPWLWAGKPIDRHPSLKIRYTEPDVPARETDSSAMSTARSGQPGYAPVGGAGASSSAITATIMRQRPYDTSVAVERVRLCRCRCCCCYGERWFGRRRISSAGPHQSGARADRPIATTALRHQRSTSR